MPRLYGSQDGRRYKVTRQLEDARNSKFGSTFALYSHEVPGLHQHRRGPILHDQTSVRAARILKRQLFASLPGNGRGPVARDPRIADSRQKVVVVDDDPTGTQTVHGVPVLTEWSLDALRSEMAGEAPVFFIVTNSRSLPPKEAREINEQIGPTCFKSAVRSGKVRRHQPKRFDAARPLPGRGGSFRECP